MSESFVEVPVDESGASLHVPRALLSDLLDAANGTGERGHEQRVDFHINTLPVGSRSGMQALGNQPSHQVLLDNIKGWPSIAGRAIAQRMRGLAKNLHVFSHHIVDGKQEMREQPEHRLTTTLQKPNAVFTLGDMIWLLSWHLTQVGEGYWQKIKDRAGKTIELWPLPPAAVIPVADRELGIAGYLVRDGHGNEIPLALDEVIRFWNPDPLTLFGSIGNLGPIATEYDQSRFLEDHLKAIFEDNATPRMVIVGKADQASIDSKTQRAFHRKWKNLFNTRVGSARSLPAFIPAGWEMKELTTHGAANDVIELKESNREQTLAAFGVPGTVVGMDKNVNRATAEALDWIFDKNTITHYADLIAEGLTLRLAREFDPKLNIGFREFVAPDKTHVLVKEKQDLDKGVRSVQQVLRDRSEDPGDAPWGELPILPFGLSPYDGDFTVENRINALGTQGLAGAGAGGNTDATSDSAPRKSRQRSIISIQSMTRDDPMDVDAAQRRAIAHGKRFAPPLGAAVLRVLRSQRLDILEKLAAIDANELLLPVEVVDMEPRQREAKMRTISENLAKRIFDPRNWSKVFSTVVEDHLVQPFAAAAQDATSTVAKKLFVFSTEAQNAIQHQTFKLADTVNRTTLRKVEKALQGSMDAAEGVAGTEKRLRKTFGRKRSIVIARTEVLTAVQTGQVTGWQSTGQVQGKQWNISGNNTRESHELTQGQRVTLGANFILGSGNTASNPGDTSLPPEDRVNCQCFLSPIIIGE